MNKWKEALKNVLWLFMFFVGVPFIFMGQGQTFFTCEPVPLGSPDCVGKGKGKACTSDSQCEPYACNMSTKKCYEVCTQDSQCIKSSGYTCDSHGKCTRVNSGKGEKHECWACNSSFKSTDATGACCYDFLPGSTYDCKQVCSAVANNGVCFGTISYNPDGCWVDCLHSCVGIITKPQHQN